VEGPSPFGAGAVEAEGGTLSDRGGRQFPALFETVDHVACGNGKWKPNADGNLSIRDIRSKT